MAHSNSHATEQAPSSGAWLIALTAVFFGSGFGIFLVVAAIFMVLG